LRQHLFPLGRRFLFDDMELQLTDRHIMALNALLVAVLIYFAALAVNDLVGLGHVTEAAPVASTHGKVAHDASANRSRAAYQAIVDRDIFNLQPPPAPPVQVVEEDLHLTLIGVTQITKGKPYAIIANQTGEQSVYQVGEEIPDAGKLLKVEKDRAIIEHGGKEVALELPTDDTSSAAAPEPSSPFAGNARRRLTPQGASQQDQNRHRHGGGRRHHFQQ
jgi:type II secretory pathway component PulC